MRLPRYENYQQPDEDWLGELPDHWNVRRTKTMFTLQKSKVGRASADFTLLSLTLGGVIVRNMDEGGKLPAEFDSYQIVQPDDLVFCLFDIDETPRTIGIAHDYGMITGAYSVYRALPSCVPEYACYYFLHLDSFKGLRPFYTGLRKVVRADTFSKVTMPAPPIDEQKQIAAFLDYETAKIDALIEKQQQLIALLGEKRQAVISHAVTKGLNPDAPMRDSGVDWLGEVPSHWEILPLRRVVTKFVDYRRKTPATTDSGIPLVTATAVRDGQVDHSRSPKFVTQATYDKWMVRGFPEVGDVVFTTEGATFGETGQIVDDSVALAQRLILFKVNPRKITNDFLYFTFLSDFGQAEQWSYTTGTTVFGIRASKLRATKFIAPPLQEQIAIAQHIDHETRLFGVAEAKAELAMDLLQERRTALISAAVTGKIDVRGWKRPSADSTLETEMEVA